MKRIVMTVLLAVLVMMPCIASADNETKTAYVSISLSGAVQCVNEEVQAEDFNGNGVVDIDDAIKAASDNNGMTYTSEDQGWGICIVNLWGDDSGCFGYYLNDGMAMNLEEEIGDGAYISVYSYQDTQGWSDSYTYFDKKNVTAGEGESVTLTLSKCHFDDSWNVVSDPFAGAKVMEGDTELGITDESGQITLELEAGEHVITAYSADAGIITVPASAVITVEGDEDEPADDADDGIAYTDDEDEPDGVIASYDPDEEEPEAAEQTEVVSSTPQTGVDMSLIAVFVLAGAALCGLVILRKRA